MFKNLLNFVVFAAGLAAISWIGAGYVGTNPLALSVTALIGACYLAGALELYRYRQATASLQQAVSALSTAPTNLGDWLSQLHPSLRHAVRLRVEGERAALPAPALTPYLVGLLVLLGMLGTLLGMMATLRGTGFALDSATDLQAMHASLAAPVKGLGFAFGTSIAGVASSAMLGLLSALCRRERVQAVQSLDLHIATTLRVYSQAHQREETFKLLQQQSELMPTLVDRLQAMISTIEQQSAAANERQLASQDSFHRHTEAAYTRLASSVEQSLKDSVTENARAASATLLPVMEATMAALARETTTLHDTITHAVDTQLEGLSSGFETSTATVAELWQQALAEHRQTNQLQAADLRSSLDHFAETFEQRSSSLLGDVFSRMDATAGNVGEGWAQALSQQQESNQQLVSNQQQALNAATATIEQQATALVQRVDQSHAGLQKALAANDQQRLAAWTDTLDSMATALGEKWQEAGTHATSRQQEICDTLAETAREMSAHSQAHARDTITEISRLVQAASEAPRAAAEVVAELRQKLSDSMVRDTAMLDERNRLMATLETLLDGVNRASNEQKGAIDALVTSSADLLDRVGNRFTDHIASEAGKLDAAAAQVTGSAVEVASLGEAFGMAVELFGASSEQLVSRLQHIEIALDKSLARSDEQLAYYVAQAREVIDLSMLSQKQIVDDLQQLARQRAAGLETA
ncbi:DUF802 domain-containing protein [Rhodanobacter sp. AS-Z3]|uniref:DUF802 domain-containing protein n=1 Tax=Rhodanobacter sp. AS-Z3 TaxID=3031330 RepID=UPI002479B14C|nr:DUF802 domain-containing protein [Rhodanobacter sp. AS-Z3]WEN16741.1 DUF802 domain-containing protein [Rhodanobacter sp. AS-Z3]